MAHLLGCYCLDVDRPPEPEAMAHPLGCHCLDVDRQLELEAMTHPLGRHCLDFDRPPEPEAMPRRRAEGAGAQAQVSVTGSPVTTVAGAMPDEPTTDEGTEVVTPAGRTDDTAHATADATADATAGPSPGPRDDGDVVDERPEDLDAAGYVGPYLFPNNNRRRVPGFLYLGVAVVCVGVWALVDDSPYVNDGFLLAAVLLAVVGAYHLVSGWNLDVDEHDALVAASRAVGFPVGHASAQMGWRGLLSRPTWRILLYSDENPPARRGLVLVDGVDGTIVQHFVEDNPEDWSELDAG